MPSESYPDFINQLIKDTIGIGIIDISDKYLTDYQKAVKGYMWMVRRNKNPDLPAKDRIPLSRLLTEISYVIMNGVRFLSLLDSNELFFYNEDEGYYQSNAENIIRVLSHEINPNLTIHNIKEIIDKIIIENYHNRSIINPDYLVGLKNGVLNLKTFELMPKSWEYYITRIVPVTYDPKAYPLEFEKYIESVTNDDGKRILLEALGYCLYAGYPFHRAFLLFGPTHSGKSTFLRIIEEFLGPENCSHVTLQQLQMENKAWFRAKLHGKLANLSPDMPNKSIYNTGIFKALTGDDKILAENKGEKPFEFRSTAKAFFTGNEIPPSEGDDSDAFYIRWIILDFPNTFTDNAIPDLDKIITTELELSGILNASLMSLVNLLHRGRFEDTVNIELKKKAYNIGSNTVKAFVLYHCQVESKLLITKSKLYTAYVGFCMELGREPKARNVFTTELSRWAKGVEGDRKKIEGKRVYIYRGIDLRPKSNFQNKDMARMPRSIPFLVNVGDSIYKANSYLNNSNSRISENKDDLGNLDTSRKDLFDTLINYAKSFDGKGFTWKEAIAYGEGKGFDKEAIVNTVDLLARRGIIFEPQKGIFRMP